MVLEDGSIGSRRALRIQTPNGESIADKGLGTHPRTALTYVLAGKYRWFEARVSLDPDAPVSGTAMIRVLVDGKEQTIAGLPLLGKGNAIPIRMALSGAKELSSITDFGSAGGVGADVNWADARLGGMRPGADKAHAKSRMGSLVKSEISASRTACRGGHRGGRTSSAPSSGRRG